MAKDGLRFLGLPDNPVDYTCDILDKELSAYNYMQYMFDRTNTMFRYEGLPETIPAYMLEYMLQVYGSVTILEHNEDIYAFRASYGGPPDPYYRPTQAVVANPALDLSYTYRIVNYFPPFNKTLWESYPKCIRFHNDTQLQGLVPLFSRYATQLAENDVSIRSAQINLRQQIIIVADNGPEIEAANKYIENLTAGRLAAIGKRPFLEGITVAEGYKGNSNTIMQLIELQQYLKASFYNDIGLNSNFNMKSQYISSEEINSSADIMLPLIDNMLKCRLEAVDYINKEFGTNISVEKDSSWEKKQIQSDLGILTPDGTSPETDAIIESIVDETLVEDSVDTGVIVGDVENDSDSVDSVDSNDEDTDSVESDSDDSPNSSDENSVDYTEDDETVEEKLDEILEDLEDIKEELEIPEDDEEEENEEDDEDDNEK